MVVAIYSTHNIATHRTRRVAIAIVIYRSDNRLLDAVDMSHCSVESYGPGLLSYPALAKLVDSIVILDVAICKLHRLICQRSKIATLLVVTAFVEAIHKV